MSTARDQATQRSRLHRQRCQQYLVSTRGFDVKLDNSSANELLIDNLPSRQIESPTYFEIRPFMLPGKLAQYVIQQRDRAQVDQGSASGLRHPYYNDQSPTLATLATHNQTQISDSSRAVGQHLSSQSGQQDRRRNHRTDGNGESQQLPESVFTLRPFQRQTGSISRQMAAATAIHDGSSTQQLPPLQAESSPSSKQSCEQSCDLHKASLKTQQVGLTGGISMFKSSLPNPLNPSDPRTDLTEVPSSNRPEPARS